MLEEFTKWLETTLKFKYTLIYLQEGHNLRTYNQCVSLYAS